jgi:hypothetical protein
MAEPPKHIAFLDVDEVLCIGHPYACLDLAKTFACGEEPSQQQLATLFSPVARNALAVVHRRSGGLMYVVSSIWRAHFTREQMVSLFNGAGFYFVAANLYEGDGWRCAPPGGGRDREAEILDWLATYHQGEPFAVIDDCYSGGRLLFSHCLPESALYGRVVICTPGVGLTMDHVDGVVAALERPL